MSRIGKMPIPVPSGVKVTIEGRRITVAGPRGTLDRELHPMITVEQEGQELHVRRPNDTRQARALHGLTRALVNNMVVGVSEGFRKKLLVNGVGFKVEETGGGLRLHLGYSHPIDFPLPEGITAKVERQKEISVTLEGTDKELLGQTAARIRALRPPEPYKGKGVQYADETIIRKAGKAAGK
ncbi:50S ribosomal protein L6 [Dissulfurirhabdus thermomarina]|uniref:Large ribosomal subunit protein uL6 n=1 Tax=Dissulfurirhabdus thermomarina TaxID=1765737 RepID=A0A6N9TMM2_DISTH|nr:50S ribosomal protein L6 [Dissulfurirhabdus thermomarina]NDY41323.1 50S ribosomal protein L6 [Dissulfurirhabdus thermomarina]NMX23294.1 50S ribosomal protein L6 [Dissulfurirhabdus thermomarina]